jgi:metal-responsive CopG/Arc/MetJ family transcriptional regulator
MTHTAERPIKTQLNLSIPVELFLKIDAAASTKGLSRSKVAVDAIETYLQTAEKDK